MRKIIFTILLTSFGLITNAQIKKGATLLGGQISFGNRQFEDDISKYEYKNSLISVNVGRAIKENTVVGIGFGYSWYSNYNSFDSSTNDSRQYDFP